MIASLNKKIKKTAQGIIKALLNGNLLNISYDKKGDVNIKIDYSQTGIYSFILKKDNQTSIVYIGKNENGARLRQHITGKNKDGTHLKPSVKTKHLKIKESINEGFQVYLSNYEDCNFDKASLSAIEISIILYLKTLQKNKKFPQNGEWNTRIS